MRENPYVQRAITGDLFERQQKLIDHKDRYYAALECLPQVISHNDLSRRNLMIRAKPGGGRELVAVDWATCGPGPLGGELHALVGLSGALFEISASELPRFDQVVFASFLNGLRAGGWNGNPDEIRLAHTAWTALWLGPIPQLVAVWTNGDNIERQFGCNPDAFADESAENFRFALNCADEAWALMDKLGLP